MDGAQRIVFSGFGINATGAIEHDNWETKQQSRMKAKIAKTRSGRALMAEMSRPVLSGCQIWFSLRRTAVVGIGSKQHDSVSGTGGPKDSTEEALNSQLAPQLCFFPRPGPRYPASRHSVLLLWLEDHSEGSVIGRGLAVGGLTRMT